MILVYRSGHIISLLVYITSRTNLISNGKKLIYLLVSHNIMCHLLMNIHSQLNTKLHPYGFTQIILFDTQFDIVIHYCIFEISFSIIYYPSHWSTIPNFSSASGVYMMEPYDVAFCAI